MEVCGASTAPCRSIVRVAHNDKNMIMTRKSNTMANMTISRFFSVDSMDSF